MIIKVYDLMQKCHKTFPGLIFLGWMFNMSYFQSRYFSLNEGSTLKALPLWKSLRNLVRKYL